MCSLSLFQQTVNIKGHNGLCLSELVEFPDVFIENFNVLVIFFLYFFFSSSFLSEILSFFNTIVTLGTVPSAVTELEGRDHRQEE